MGEIGNVIIRIPVSSKYYNYSLTPEAVQKACESAKYRPLVLYEEMNEFPRCIGTIKEMKFLKEINMFEVECTLSGSFYCSDLIVKDEKITQMEIGSIELSSWLST